MTPLYVGNCIKYPGLAVLLAFCIQPSSATAGAPTQYIEDFETGFIYGGGCNQLGWQGFCSPGVGFIIVDDPEASFGEFSAAHISDGSGFSGFDILSPQFAPSNAAGGVDVDIVIADQTSLYQFVAINPPTGQFNTRVNFELTGSIRVLQSGDCTVGSFEPTTGTWSPGVVTRIGIEVPGDGSLTVYQDGEVIFTGSDIAGQCSGNHEGIGQLGIFATNTGTTARLVIDNIGDPCREELPCPCPADIAPPPTGDGVVNVDDLLAVINSWSQSGPPRPVGDVAPLPAGDCIVNVDDLLAVINAWGGCPDARGACCLTDGTCVASQTEAECAKAVGTWQGCGTVCADVVCPGE